MSTIDMTQVAGIQAVNAEGKVIGTLSVDDLTELVATKIVQEAKNEAVSARSASVMSEASTLAATDEYEDQLALDTNPAYIRSLDSNGNPKRTAIASLASVVGGLLPEVTINNKGLASPIFCGIGRFAPVVKIIPNKTDYCYSKIQAVIYDNGSGGEVELLLSGIGNTSVSNLHSYRKSGNNAGGINVKQDNSGTVYISTYSLGNCVIFVYTLGCTVSKNTFKISSVSKEEYQGIEGQLIDVNTY